MLKRHKFRTAGTLALLAVVMLFIPECPRSNLTPPPGQRVKWSATEHLRPYERLYLDLKRRGCAAIQGELNAAFADVDTRLEAVIGRSHSDPDRILFNHLQQSIFHLASHVAACPPRIGDYAILIARVRSTIKQASRRWPLEQRAVRESIYRLLYGSRIALEAAWLQSPTRVSLPTTVDHSDKTVIASVTPSTVVHGIRVHSGDILVSRGGQPTSALIARGNDFPGNFSHVSIVHVAPDGRARVIESLIETGMTMTNPADYLGDHKLRIMLLRPRADLPQIVADPNLPHRAAEEALKFAQQHRPYDFAMDATDHKKLFCSEVVFAAYRSQGFPLWAVRSPMSSPGLVRWLASLGVTNFTTYSPSDIEYDPRLAVVAEWRDPTQIVKAHIDNAAIDQLLKKAEHGLDLSYNIWLLPVSRLAKGYSALVNLFGLKGPIPEGMSATAALRVKQLRKWHQTIFQQLHHRARTMEKQHGYRWWLGASSGS